MWLKALVLELKRTKNYFTEIALVHLGGREVFRLGSDGMTRHWPTRYQTIPLFLSVFLYKGMQHALYRLYPITFEQVSFKFETAFGSKTGLLLFIQSAQDLAKTFYFAHF